jgi:hypothetical protein
MSKTQEGLADPRFPCSASNSESTPGDATCLVRGFAKATHIPATTMFQIVIKLLGRRFCHWRWVPHLLSDDHKADRAPPVLMLLAAMTAAEKRRRLNVWTGDECGIIWVPRPTRSLMTIDEELPQRLRETIGGTKSMLMVFFSLMEFARVDSLP